jgi:hypothetical protein
MPGNANSGSRPGERRGGRQKGALNKRTLAREAALREKMDLVRAALPTEAFQGDAHAFLVAVYCDPSIELSIRLDAAGKAIAYEKPRLAAVSHVATDVRPFVFALPPVAASTEEWLRTYGPSQEATPNCSAAST